METTSRRHVVIDTPDGKLTWLEVVGPRGPIIYQPRLDDRLLNRDEFARRRMAALFGVSMST